MPNRAGGVYGGWSFGWHQGSPRVTVWFHNKGWHILPSYVNLLNNVALRLNSSKSPVKEIVVYNHPFVTNNEWLSQSKLIQSVTDTSVGMIILGAFAYVPATAIIYLLNERTRKEKRLQYICGVGTFLYWLTSLLWDMMSYILTIALVTVIAAAFDLPTYTYGKNLQAFVVILLCYGWATIPLMYLLMSRFDDTGTAYIALSIANLFIGINTTAITFFLDLPVFRGYDRIEFGYAVLSRAFMIFPQYCLGDALVKLAKNQLLTEVLQRFNLDNYQTPFSFDLLGWHFSVLGIQGLTFFFMVIYIECSEFALSLDHPDEVVDDEDDDVAEERDRVMCGDAEDDTLVLHELTKIYKRSFSKVTAVEDLCLGVGKGECFGLLGVNGAGKTTTFKMITGDTFSSRGAALLNGDLISEDVKLMKQDVGYCPQFDALDDQLTGLEMLQFYARLRGIAKDKIDEVCAEAILHFDLTLHARKTLKQYSIGNKRKLSMAIALLGNPQLVLLDEPTTGMDPGTRRLVWNKILELVKYGKSILFTSHSMAECDALCTRLAIMVNGKFVCIGSGQHLKDKFGKGYTITVRAKDKASVNGIKMFLDDVYPGTVVKGHHLLITTFEIPFNGFKLSSLFVNLEQNKEVLGILEYSVSQTTLDQVFLNFANHQTDGISDNDQRAYSVEQSNWTPLEDLSEEWSGTPNDAFMWGKSSMERTYHGPGGHHTSLPSGFFHRNISLPLDINAFSKDKFHSGSQLQENLLNEVQENNNNREWIGHGLRITTSNDLTTAPITNFYE